MNRQSSTSIGFDADRPRLSEKHGRFYMEGEQENPLWLTHSQQHDSDAADQPRTGIWNGKRLMVLLAVYGLILLTVAFFYKAAYQSLMEEVGGKARDLAMLIAINVHPEDIENIHGPHDIDTPSFKRIHHYFEKVKATQPDLKYIDIFRPPSKSGAPGHWTFVVDLYPSDTDLNGNGIIEKDEEGVLPGRIYEPKDPADERMWEAALHRPSTSSDRFWSDEWGTYISGFASIHDPATQKPVALLEVDTTAERFAQKRREILIVSLVAAGVLLVMATVALVELFRRSQSLARIRTLTHNLYVMATEDGLTGVTNRRHFFELGEHAVTIAHRYERPLSLVMLDADHFKRVNDVYGHKAGDKVLINMAHLCRESVRASDLIGRFGGEEFLILMPEMALEGALQVAQRLRALIEETVVHTDESERVSVTASIGVAQLEPEMKTLDALLAKTDEALYKAKSNGRNCVVSA